MKKLLLLICLCPAFAGAQEPGMETRESGTDTMELALQVGIVGANLADYATTKIALGQGAQELNPFSRALLVREPGAAGVKGAMTLGQMVLVHHLLKNPRTRKLGIVVAVVAIAVPATLAIHNGRQLR